MNSAFNALRWILQGSSPAPKSNPHLLDYRDETTFRDLWVKGLESDDPIINGTEFNWRDGEQQLLIVGNDPPDGIFEKRPASLQGINFNGHFTAASWLAAWKVKFAPAEKETQSGKKEAMVRIAVIDLRESNLPGGAARAVQAILGARGGCGRSLVPRALVLNTPCLATICQWLRESKEDHRVTRQQLPELLKSTIWNELISDREQNHALSNVLGALLLSSQIGKGAKYEGEPRVQEYLLTLAQACGVEASLGQVKLKEHQGFQRWVTPEHQKDIQGIVLIDDMAGPWEYFLRGASGFAGDAQFGSPDRTYRESLEVFGKDRFSDGIVQLPDRLSKLLSEKVTGLDASDLLGSPTKIRDRFVLFLDLRLFLETSDIERTFLNKLADFGTKLLDSGRSLPWLDTKEKNDKLRSELKQILVPAPVSSGGLPPEQSLLPRLLALFDPTLPIIIFSSTHRTELVDPFRDYGNIITTFRKPILGGMTRNWTETVKALHTDFVSAMEQAARVLKTRRSLSRLEVGEPPLAYWSPTRAHRIIEIYIDESGDPFKERDPGFSVGGIMLRHENNAAREAFHRTIDQSSRKWGVSDHAPDRIKAGEVEQKLPQISFFPKRPMPNGADETEGFNLVLSALTEQSRISAFALIDPDLLRFNRDSKLDSAILFDRNALDNVYHSLLRANLEMLLFQHPWVDINIDSIFIHVATRQQEMGDTPTRMTWHQAYGLEFKERRGRWGYTSLGGDDVFRIVRGILQTREHSNRRPDIVMARGVTLNDYEDVVLNFREGPQKRARVNSQLYDPSRVDPHQIHYLADWIARIALYRSKTLPSVSAPWFDSGYIQQLNGTFSALIDACWKSELDRAINRLDGIALSPVADLRSSRCAERYLRQTASTWPRKLTGLQLHRLFAK